MTLAPDTPVLFVHGYWHGSWCWSQVTAQLAASGTRAAALDTAGHGLHARWPAAATRRPFDPKLMATEPSPARDIDLDTAGELLIGQIRALGRGHPVVVVAHSMSGTLLARAAQLVPDLVAHAVYLTAAIPVSGKPTSIYLAEPAFQDSLMPKLIVADPEQVGAIRIDPLSGDPEYQDLVRAAFYHDVEPEVASNAMRLLTPDAPRSPLAADLTTLTADGFGRVPRSFVLCTRDRVLPLGVQRKSVEYTDAAFPDNPTAVYTLESSHSPFLSMPGKVAEIVRMILAA